MLYLSDINKSFVFVDLFKAEPKAPGVAAPASPGAGVGAAGPKAPAAPAAPAAPGAPKSAAPKLQSAGPKQSKSIDCPLGKEECIKNGGTGKHVPSSNKYQDHAKLAQAKGASAPAKAAETPEGKLEGAEASPAVTQESANIGSIGSDKAPEPTAAQPAETQAAAEPSAEPEEPAAPTRQPPEVGAEAAKAAEESNTPQDKMFRAESAYRISSIMDRAGKKDLAEKYAAQGLEQTKDFSPEQHKEFADRLSADPGQSGLTASHAERHRALERAGRQQKGKEELASRSSEAQKPAKAPATDASQSMTEAETAYHLSDIAHSKGNLAEASKWRQRGMDATKDFTPEQHSALSDRLKQNPSGLAGHADYHSRQSEKTDVGVQQESAQAEMWHKLAATAERTGDADGAKQAKAKADSYGKNLSGEEHEKLKQKLIDSGNEAYANKLSVPSVGKDSPTPTPAQAAADSEESMEGAEAAAPEEQEPESPYAAQISEVHAQQSARAKSVLAEAKAKHEETKKKAQELRDSNAKKVAEYESDLKNYEKQKEGGAKKIKKPKKPTLEKEPKVDEHPELKEPETDSELLSHENHVERAKKNAELIESHLLNNPTISDAERSRLNRAHAVSVFHSNIDHVPTAAHRAELAQVERAAKDLGIKETGQQQKRREDAGVQAAAAKDQAAAEAAAAKDAERSADVERTASAAKQTMSDREQAFAEKQKAATAKEEAKKPQPPQNDMETAQLADHNRRAATLRANLESHLKNNPNMREVDKNLANSILSASKEHADMSTMPTSDHSRDLRSLEKMAGSMGKAEFSPSEDKPAATASGGAKGKGRAVNTLGYLGSKMREGWFGAGGMANAAISPTGAGSLGQQVVNYGVSGAAGLGHQLLISSGGGPTTSTSEGQKDEQAKQQQNAAPAQNSATQGQAASQSQLEAAAAENQQSAPTSEPAAPSAQPASAKPTNVQPQSQAVPASKKPGLYLNETDQPDRPRAFGKSNPTLYIA